MGEKPEIRWQSQINSIKEGVIKIYETKEFADVQFVVKGDHRFKAHKLVLSAQSPVFESMLLKSMNVPDVIIIEEDSITATGFEILLCFIYTNNMRAEDKKSIIEAYKTAVHFQQQSLQFECEKKIHSWTLTKDDVWETLNDGLQVSMVREKCNSFIRDNTKEALDCPSFLKISFKCMSTILEDGVLKSVPVLPRLHKIMEWASKRYFLTEKDYSLVRKDFLETDPPLLDKLEFEKLKLDDLAVVVKEYKGLLTSAEVMKFMEYSRDKNNVSVLPAWCTP